MKRRMFIMTINYSYIPSHSQTKLLHIMSTRDPKRTYTIESDASNTTEQTSEVAATEVHKTEENSKGDSTTVQTTRPIRKLEVRKRSRTLAELKASIDYCKKFDNKRALIEKDEEESKKKLLDAVKACPNASLVDKASGEMIVSGKKSKPTSDESSTMEDAPDSTSVPRPFRRCRKNGVLHSLFKKLNERENKGSVSEPSSELVASVPTNTAYTHVPFKPTLYEQPRMNVEVDFEKNVTSFDNTLTSFRIKHPPRKMTLDMNLGIVGKGLKGKGTLKRRRRSAEEDGDEDEDDEDYDPEEDDDEDEDDEDGDEEDDEYEPPVEGLPKGVMYSQPEEKWIKEAPEAVQKQIVEQENKLVKAQLSETPLRFRVLQSPNLTDRSRANIIRMIDDMNECMPFGSDFNKMAQRMNLLEKIPFDNYIQPLITSKDTPENIGNFLMGVKETMDKAVFGHTVAKQQIISILAREISNPKSVGNVFAIQGPMGNGKTTLAKEGICKAMNRPFAFISLGGMQDSSHFTGHSFTYEGSKPGRIVEILIETGCMNPVIYFDELDKVSETKHGEEIIHLLCHLTDSSQNALFQDKYFSGIELDLSKATFIFSYNDESRINPILLDRMIKIRTDGFDTDAKMVIAKNYLIPILRGQFQFSETDVEINDDVLRQIMSQYTQNEKGVRNLKRCLDAIMAKCNILRYIPAEQQKSMGFAVKGFKMPYKMTLESLSQFLEKDEQVNPSVSMMYM